MNTKKNYKILIAEDEESLAMLIDYNLIKDGYQTNIVKNSVTNKYDKHRKRVDKQTIFNSSGKKTIKI